jgi:hypothetical protein
MLTHAGITLRFVFWDLAFNQQGKFHPGTGYDGPEG